jgi:hypothetical protein
MSVEDAVGVDSPIDRALALRDGAVYAANDCNHTADVAQITGSPNDH